MAVLVWTLWLMFGAGDVGFAVVTLSLSNFLLFAASQAALSERRRALLLAEEAAKARRRQELAEAEEGRKQTTAGDSQGEVEAGGADGPPA
ncbi:hypothetical protein [Kitasatospora sp. GP82]|uniref:hypothetical protein n=1 Tax=Kitasatospora sp. GP82 TaxID=3035089 RepID=UPI00247633D9|nr:hypothetical protein [Kitasatospora sp. GP82]